MDRAAGMRAAVSGLTVAGRTVIIRLRTPFSITSRPTTRWMILADHSDGHTDEGHDHPDGGGAPRGPKYRGG
jgi:hypothetical protein